MLLKQLIVFIIFSIAYSFGCMAQERSHFIKHYGINDEFNCPRINCLAQDSKGFIWIGSNIGLTRFDGCHFRSFSMPTVSIRAFASQPHHIVIDAADRIWLGTMKGVFVFDSMTETFYHLNERFPALTNSVNRMLTVPKDRAKVLIAHGEKYFIAQFDPMSCEEANRDEWEKAWQSSNFPILNKDVNWGKYSNSISVSLCDKEGGTWAGTFYDGLYYYSKGLQLFSEISSSDNIRPNIIRTICPMKNGSIYLGTEDKGVFTLDTLSRTLRPLSNLQYRGKPTPTSIHSLAGDGDTLWIGSLANGVFLYDTQKKSIVNNFHVGDGISGLRDNFIVQLFKTKGGDVFIGTIDGLYVFEKAKGKISLIEGTENSYIHCIAQTSNGTLWVGALNKPILKIQRTQPVQSSNDNSYKWTAKPYHGFSHPCTTTLLVDSDDNVLVGTDNAGIWKITQHESEGSSECKRILSEEQVKSSINYMLLDKQNRLWISTFNGLFCFEQQTERLAHFTKKDGLLTNSFNYNSGYITENGIAYVGTYNGLITFNSSDFHMLDKSLKPYISNVCVGGKDSLITSELHLKYDSPSFYIDYSVPTYAYLDKIYYRYILEGSNMDWQIINNQNQRIFFSHLSAGNYKFLLQASYNPNNWNGKTAELNIFVSPPFWYSIWAYLIYIALVISVLIMAFIFWKNYDERKVLKTQISKLLENQEYLRSSSALSPYALVKEMTPKKLGNAFLEKIDSFLEHSIYDYDLSVDTLAEHMNMSKSTLYRKVKAATSISPNDYISMYRLNTAAKLLKEEDLAIKEISERLKFSSVSYFSNCFNKHFGVTPGEYKRNQL